MIIVSQDKKGILNFDNIQLCQTDKNGTIYTILNEYDSFELGEYATEERAKEILIEITEHINFGVDETYEMPEE